MGRGESSLWTSLGPEGGIITLVAVDPRNGSTVFAANLDDGGIFKSKDGGKSWTLSSTELPALQLRTLAIDPETPSTIYVGTHFSGVFKSTDEGTHWVPSSLRASPVSALAIDPQ